MADNTSINAGAGGDVIATDELTTINGGASTGVKVQRVKVGFGIDGDFNDASTASPLPVTTDTQAHATYSAVMARVATAALTANTAKNVLSFEHAASSTKTMRLRSLKISGYATTAVAGTVEFRLSRGTAASTGGTTITAQPAVPGDVAADTVVKSLPTITAATVLIAGNMTSVPATANSTIGMATEFITETGIDGAQDFTLRAGFLDTLCLSIISTGAINVTLNVTALFTEE